MTTLFFLCLLCCGWPANAFACRLCMVVDWLESLLKCQPIGIYSTVTIPSYLPLLQVGHLSTSLLVYTIGPTIL